MIIAMEGEKQSQPIKLSVDVSIAQPDQLSLVQNITNEAFMADAFFKKPEYHQRFTSDDIKLLLSEENSLFLIASDKSTKEICGSLYLHWEKKDSQDGIDIVGKFSAVSVPERYGKRGIGKGLVRGAEEYLLKQAKILEEQGSAIHNVSIEMGVINQRTDLFPWYESQGFRVIGELPNDEELNRIIQEGWNIFCILMRKQLYPV